MSYYSGVTRQLPDQPFQHPGLPRPDGMPHQPPGMRPRPIPPERPRGSPVTKLFLLCLLGVGVYGGYYGYCSYKVNGLEYTLSGEV